MNGRVMPLVVIYRHPVDYPLDYVVRRHWVCDDRTVEVEFEPIAVVDTLDQARRAVPPQFDYHMPRSRGDDPTIVEVWL